MGSRTKGAPVGIDGPRPIPIDGPPLRKTHPRRQEQTLRPTTAIRTAAAVSIVVLALGGGGVAYAFFSASGSGTGTADVGTGPVGTLQITSTGPSTALTPWNGSQPFDVSIHNNSLTDSGVGTISMSVSRFQATGDAATSSGQDIVGCAAAWFSVSPTLVVNQPVGAGATVTAQGLGLVLPTVSMIPSVSNQDACQGSTVGIAFASDG